MAWLVAECESQSAALCNDWAANTSNVSGGWFSIGINLIALLAAGCGRLSEVWRSSVVDFQQDFMASMNRDVLKGQMDRAQT